MSVDLQTDSQICSGCKKTFQSDELSTFYGAANQEYTLCAICVEEKIAGCYLCEQKVVEINDRAVEGSVSICTKEEITRICKACAEQSTCVICEKSIKAKQVAAKPRILSRDKTFLCGSCSTTVAGVCPKCKDAIVTLRDAPYSKDVVESGQVDGGSLWHCAQCGVKSQFKAYCICQEPLFLNGEKIVSYEPEKINNRIYICNVCGKGKRILCDGCNENVVAIQLDKGNTLIDSKTYSYSGLTMCQKCRRGAKICLCFTPAATGEEKVLNGAKAYPSSFKGNDYRCKFCNTLPIVDNEPADAFKLKEALYDKVYLWFTTPGSGPGLSTNEEKPICVMLDYNGLEQRESGIINGRYHRDTKIITVARAVTPVMFIAIFAHELTHYWQDQQGLPDKQEKMIYEGFAEWVAYTCLTTMLPGFTEERDKQEAPRMLEQMKSNLSLAYSDGLKHFLKIEKTQGRAGVLLEAQKVEKEV